MQQPKQQPKLDQFFIQSRSNRFQQNSSHSFFVGNRGTWCDEVTLFILGKARSLTLTSTLVYTSASVIARAIFLAQAMGTPSWSEGNNLMDMHLYLHHCTSEPPNLCTTLAGTSSPLHLHIYLCLCWTSVTTECLLGTSLCTLPLNISTCSPPAVHLHLCMTTSAHLLSTSISAP